jgi:uncharacterized membrane protein
VSDEKTPGAPEGALDVTDPAAPEPPVADLASGADVEPATPTAANPLAVPDVVDASMAPEPTPTVSATDASWSRPAGSAAPPPFPASPSADANAERPEVLVGAAFAGGLVVAMLLKRLGR